MACHRCGECCRRFAITLNPGEKKMELMAAHGYDTSKEISINIYHACQYLDESTNLCKIYEGPDDDRPQICKDFICPRAQNHIRGEI
jgi:Fe-S-cluster containining protein